MNFKKIALVLALASSVSAFAQEAPTPSFDLTALASTTNTTAVPAALALLVPFLNVPVTSNTAYVIQQATDSATDVGSMAYVDQSGDVSTNFAAVLQQGVGALAYVKQTTLAASNTAILYSNDSVGGTPLTVGLATGTIIDSLAEAEFLAATLVVDGNVQLVEQTDIAGANVAYIYAMGSKNFAAITQSAGVGGNTALISQLGNGNRAYIKQASVASTSGE